MKKILSLLLAVSMLVCALGVLSSCGKKDAEIAIYVGDQLYDFDPALAFVNDDAVKVMSLLFEPLFRMNAKGKLEKALAKSYKIIEDEKNGIYQMEIVLRETYWSDRSRVTADDLYYAWMRILDPEFESQAAPLLYDIKNALAIKQGEEGISRDDIGLEPNLDTITITFEGKIDYDAFLRNLSCVALVPLPETKVIANESIWSKKSSFISCNGPFCIRSLDSSTGEFTLKRNEYYRSELGEADASDIKPSMLVMDWTDENFGDVFDGSMNRFLEDKVNKFLDHTLENTIFYIGSMPMDEYKNGDTYQNLRKQYLKDTEIVDTLSTYTYIFNTTKEPFNDENVRKALSMAIDREYIASCLVYNKAANGLISNGVWDADSYRESFRENADASKLISTTANMDAAKALIQGASISDYDITLAVRNTPEDVFIAQYVAEQWEELGFYVELEFVTFDKTVWATDRDGGRVIPFGTGEITVYDDGIQAMYMDVETADFDVIGVDYNMYSVNAFTALAGFTSTMNGNGVEFKYDAATGQTTWSDKLHCCGFSDPVYDEIMTNAYNTKDLKARAAYLHQAEEYLMSKMPVMPIVYNVNYYMVDGITGLKTDAYGFVSFTDARLK